MPENDDVEALSAALDIKNQLLETLTAELARTTVLLRRATAALDAVVPTEAPE